MEIQKNNKELSSSNSSSEEESLEEGSQQESNNQCDIDDEIKSRIIEFSPKKRFMKFNEEIGSGSYKVVYKAYDNDSGCEVAWNVVKLQKISKEERTRINKEVQLLGKLNHPNIINYINGWVNQKKNEFVFVTEILTGGNLKSYLKKIRYPRLKVIKSWCRSILEGIEYLHLQKPHPIIHRDLKCENIFINSNLGEIKIGDLGLATHIENSHTKSVLGTPEFMAPEIYEENYGPACDIYSFGMCVLEMVTLETPYRECSNPAQIYKKVMNGVKCASFDLIADEKLKEFINKCIGHKDSRPTASELLKDEFLEIKDSDSDNLPVKLYNQNNSNEEILGVSLKNITKKEETKKSEEENKTNNKNSFDRNSLNKEENKELICSICSKKELEKSKIEPEIIISNVKHDKSEYKFSFFDESKDLTIELNKSISDVCSFQNFENHIHDKALKLQSEESKNENDKKEKSEISQNKSLSPPLTDLMSLHINTKKKPSYELSDSSSCFNHDLFCNFYANYIKTYTEDIFHHESEEQMITRQAQELHELIHLHTLQKESFHPKTYLFNNQSNLNAKPLNYEIGTKICGDFNSDTSSPYLKKNYGENIPLIKSESHHTKSGDNNLVNKISERNIDVKTPNFTNNNNSNLLFHTKPSILNFPDIISENLESSQSPIKTNYISTSLSTSNSLNNLHIIDVNKKELKSPIKEDIQTNSLRLVQSYSDIQNLQNNYKRESPSLNQKKLKDNDYRKQSPSYSQTQIPNQTSIKDSNDQNHLNKGPKKEKTYEEIEKIYKIIEHSKLKKNLSRTQFDNSIEETKNLQICLDALLPDVVIDNGHYGHYTEKLVKSFQEKNSLKINGIVDENCWNSIKNEIIKKRKNPSEEKQKKILEAEENKKNIKLKQTIESTQLMNKIENSIMNEFILK